MATLRDARLYGGIGSILMLLFIAPYGYIIALIGLALVTVAIYTISNVAGTSSIFRNYLIFLLLSMAGVAIFIAIGATAIVEVVEILMGEGDPTAVIGRIIVSWLIFVALATIAAVFLRRSYRSISQALNVGMFSIVGLLYLIGTVALVILVGVFILIIALILQIIAFFSIPEELPKPATEIPPPPIPL
ncbi:MAG: DUF996 domain-containing protein [Sulfolobales archaeon]|nr:DUF996 domain-containing protein [Sulfolobales archaeon]